MEIDSQGQLGTSRGVYRPFFLIVSLEMVVGLWGPDPGSELFSQTNPYTTGPFSISLWSANWSLTWNSVGGCWNQVSTPLRCLWCRFSPTVLIFVQVTSHTILTYDTFMICNNCPSCSANQELRWFYAAMETIYAISPSWTMYLTYPLIYVSQLHVTRYFNSHSLNQHNHICSRII